jgi:hypothetical protein
MTIRLIASRRKTRMHLYSMCEVQIGLLARIENSGSGGVGKLVLGTAKKGIGLAGSMPYIGNPQSVFNLWSAPGCVDHTRDCRTAGGGLRLINTVAI